MKCAKERSLQFFYSISLILWFLLYTALFCDVMFDRSGSVYWIDVFEEVCTTDQKNYPAGKIVSSQNIDELQRVINYII